LKNISVETPDLTKFGNNVVNIIRTDTTKEAGISLQFSDIFNKALAKESFYYEIFSSEENNWLLDRSTNIKYKPDLFVSSIAFTEPKPSKLKSSNRSAIPYFNEFVKFIFEAKIVKISHDHLGKLIYYLKLMNNVQPVSYGIIFNTSNFYFMESRGGSISRIEEGTFSSPGAYEYILFTIKNSRIPIIELYDQALNHFSNILSLNTSERPFTFIGSGKYGKVFSCVVNGSNANSLKLVKLGSDGNSMDFEEIQTELESFEAVYKLGNYNIYIIINFTY
jgi:hypothetical protein